MISGSEWLQHPGTGWTIARWLEHLETTAEPELVADDGIVAGWRHGRVRYLAAWPEPALADEVIARAAHDAGLAVHIMPEGLRLRRAGNRAHLFNYSASPIEIPPTVAGRLVLGTQRLGPAGVAVIEQDCPGRITASR